MSTRVVVKVNSTDVLDYQADRFQGSGGKYYIDTSRSRCMLLAAGDQITASFSGLTSGYTSTIFRLTVEYLGENPNA